VYGTQGYASYPESGGIGRRDLLIDVESDKMLSERFRWKGHHEGVSHVLKNIRIRMKRFGLTSASEP
jgi:hypothetical protein